MKSRSIMACGCAVGCLSLWTLASAAVRLPPILGDNMVLQQRSSITIWGWAEPGESIRVKAGWMNAPVTTVAGSDGKWQVRIGTTRAGGPYVMTIQGKNRIVMKNVMLGEVWVCSGQSNMDGKSFGLAATVPNEMPDSTVASITKSFPASLPMTRARFLRVKATGIGQCPPWHPGRGEDAWLFVDEIIVN